MSVAIDADPAGNASNRARVTMPVPQAVSSARAAEPAATRWASSVVNSGRRSPRRRPLLCRPAHWWEEHFGRQNLHEGGGQSRTSQCFAGAVFGLGLSGSTFRSAHYFERAEHRYPWSRATNEWQRRRESSNWGVSRHWGSKRFRNPPATSSELEMPGCRGSSRDLSRPIPPKSGQSPLPVPRRCFSPHRR